MITQFLAQYVLHVGGETPHQVCGVPQFGLSVMDPQVEGDVGFAMDHDSVEARELELRRPEASGSRFVGQTANG